MTSPELIRELQVSRPTASVALRAHVRALSTQETTPATWRRFRLPIRRAALIAIPAAAALAFASAGVLGLARSGGTPETARQLTPEKATPGGVTRAGSSGVGGQPALPGVNQDSTIGPTDGRAQRVSATLTVEVHDSNAVSRAAQDALDLTRRLGGHVVSASVATGEQGSASLTVRVPVARVQEAIVGFSSLGRIVSQQVTIDDLQENLDQLQRREASVRNQIALIGARLATESLDAETRAMLESRFETLRGEFRSLHAGIASTSAEARMSTIQVTVGTPGAFGVVVPPSRLNRTIDGALNVFAWEAVVAFGLLIVLAPMALIALAAWLGRRSYRRREEERLLAMP